MKQALRRGYDYFHILSGNTFVTKSIGEVCDFFEQQKEPVNYVEVVDLDENDEFKDWFQCYHFLHVYNVKNKIGNAFDCHLTKLQKALGVKRHLKIRYKGYFYAHYTGEFVQYALKFVEENPQYFRQLKTCYIPEEFFFQNIIMCSPFKDSICNDCLIYTAWGDHAASFLSEKDYVAIKAGKYLFARKFARDSKELLGLLCKDWESYFGG